MRSVSVLVISLCASLCEATELVYGIENEIKDYNISRSIDKNAFSLAELVTEGLFSQKADSSLVPDLVKSYKRAGKNWTFQLRRSRFSNGKLLGCDDVKAVIEEARLSPRPVKSRLRDIVATRCDEKGNLVIETAEEAPQLIERMGYIIRVYDVSTIHDKNPVGSGPYKIVRREGKDLILERNPYYPHPKTYDQIRLRTLRDPWLRDLALFSGNVDFLLESFSLKRLMAYEKNKGVKLYRNPSPMLFYLVLKASKFTLDQRKKIAEILYEEKVSDNFWGSQAQSVQKMFSRNQNKEAKHKNIPFDKKLEIEVSCVADETQLAFLGEIAKKLLPYNVALKLRPLEFASYMKKLNQKNFEAYFFYVDTSHPQNLEALLHSRGNRLEVQDPELDAVFAEISKADNQPKLLALEEKLDEIILRKSYFIPLYRPYRELVTSPRIVLSQSPDSFWKDLLNSQKVK